MSNLMRKIWHKALQLRPQKVVRADIVTVRQEDLLERRFAFITGGTSGIGLAIAKAFINAGASVAIAARNEEKLDLAIGELSALLREGQRVAKVKIDCTNTESFEKIITSAEKDIQCECFDILVNNAGTGGGMWGSCNYSDFDKVMNTNLRSAFFLSHEFAKRMRSHKKSGNILNIVSSSGIRPANSAYMLSKWGLRGLTVGLAKTLIKYGIVVNGIAPGPTATPMLNTDSDNVYLPSNPTGRFALPEEIANFAVMLCSEAGRMIVGDIVYMTGGSGITTFDDIKYDF